MNVQEIIETNVTGATLTLDAEEWKDLLAVCHLITTSLHRTSNAYVVCRKIRAGAGKP